MGLLSRRDDRAKARIGRRVFLAALGAGVATPLAHRFASQATAAPLGRVPRLFIYFVPHGVPIEHSAVTQSFDLAESGVGVWSPLTPYKDQLIIPQGIGNYVADNHEAIRSTLTGGDDIADSIDHLIAQGLGVTSHVLGAHAYRVGNPGPDHDCKLFRQGTYVTPELNPASAWDAMFDSAVHAQTELEARNLALALTGSQLEALRTELGQQCSDASGLSEHLNALSELEARGDKTCHSESDLATAMAFRDADPHDPALLASVIRGHLEVAAQGMVCGAARVIGMQNLHANAQVMMNFSGGPGLGYHHHDPLSHAVDNVGRARFATCQKWFVSELVSGLVTKLDQPDPLDASHTVLENSVILFVTEVVDGNGHHTDHKQMWLNSDLVTGNVDTYMPWFILGGGAGRLSTGQVVPYTSRDHRDLLSTVAAVMGVSIPNVTGRNVTLLSEILV